MKEILKIQVRFTFENLNKMNTFAPPFFNPFNLSLNRKGRVIMRAMIKKLNIFTLQLPIYYILEQEI